MDNRSRFICFLKTGGRWNNISGNQPELWWIECWYLIGLFTVAIFGSFLASFLAHFRSFGSKQTIMMSKMKWKMTWKMVTVNALKRKHFENETKMHFTYLRQCSAYSNSTSKDFVKLFLSPKHVVTHCWDNFGSLQLKLLSLRIWGL